MGKEPILKCFEGSIWVLLKDSYSGSLGFVEKLKSSSCKFLRIGDKVLVDAPMMHENAKVYEKLEVRKDPRQIVIPSSTKITDFIPEMENLSLADILDEGITYYSDLTTPV